MHFSSALNPRRVARSLSTILVVTLLQITIGVQAPSSYAASGSVGSSTASGSCASTVGETSYVTATFINSAFCLLKFTTSTSWTIPSGVNAIDILIVGGGGGGGADGGGGGGGGEVRITSGVAAPTGVTINVTVGNGGTGSSHTPGIAGTYGGTSSLVISGTTYSAGGGANAVGWQEAASYALAGSGGSGGSAVTGSTNYSRGGRNSAQTNLGVGSVGYDGVSTSFTGTSLTFAGGGGGGICSENLTQGSFGGLAGGAGGGGRGAQYIYNYGSDAGQPGTNGLGGGGGGGSACGSMGTNGNTTRTPGGRGGDGVVYIKYVPVVYLAANPQSTSGAVGSTVTFTSTPYATISGATRTKKWQVLVPGGSWSDIAGATGSDSYTTPTLTRSMHGNQYRYIVTDTAGSAYSSTASVGASLSVTSPYQSETDTSLTFNGTNQYVWVADGGSSTLDLTGTLTLEAWVKPENACSSSMAVISKQTYQLYCNSGKWGVMVLSNGSGTGDLSSIPVEPDEWHHIAVTKSSASGNVLFYYDGVLAQTVSTGVTTITPNNYDFEIGRYKFLGSYFNGKIDEVRVYNSQRNQAQIRSDMNSYGLINESDLVAYYDFNEGVGATLYNRKTAADAGTDLAFANGPTWADVKTVDTNYLSVYTLVQFPRNYLTVNGGWKAPVTKDASLLVVAGGGGGGGGLQGGGGGGGGVIETKVNITSASSYGIQVGAGGLGRASTTAPSVGLALPLPTNGVNSIAFSLTAIGGGAGAVESALISPYHNAATSGGSGGGGTWGNNQARWLGASGTIGQGFKGGDSKNRETSSGCADNNYVGAGGGGAGGVGQDAQCTKGGDGGPGFLSKVIDTTVGGGGGGSHRGAAARSYYQGNGGSGGGGASAYTSNAAIGASGGAVQGSANTGGGGGAGLSSGDSGGFGGNGGSGFVAVRWINASAPVFAPPTIAYLNAGMTETFTTNVAQDSATVTLTRTFRWESITPSSGGAYQVIKQGTGATNASVSWVPTDTTTSGSGYLYRVIVTDSDTAGLFIQDTSTPVYAVINQPLRVTGSTSVPKAINLQRSETYTITLGTPTYRASLSPVIPGITLDTSTAGFAVIRIAETVTVGTYLETLTVLDSVSAAVVIPLVITVASPPQLTNTAEIIQNSQVFHVDASNSASFAPGVGGVRDISGSNKPITISGSVTYSSDFSGIMNFSSSNLQFTNPKTLSNWTLEAYVRINSNLSAGACVITGEAKESKMNFELCLDSARTIYGGFWIDRATGTDWTYKRSTEVLQLGTWYHLSATFNGSQVFVYINGTSITVKDSSTDAGLVVPNTDGFNVFVGRYSFDATTLPMSLGFARIYEAALSQNQVLQNYNATKDRFLLGNQSQLTPSKKYGTVSVESFTATSGYETKTVTLSTGDRAGIDWDTSTVTNRINLSLQESLTVGTYYDTITVTDSLGQSTFLPISMNVTKADTLTITMGASLTTVYNGLQLEGAPKATITGLVGVDTATVSTLFKIETSSALSCAQGGYCKIGDTGPGGGLVFYVSDTYINAVDGVSSGGVYLEVAPRAWDGVSSGETNDIFASLTSSVSGTSSAIGTGAQNSLLFAQAYGSSATAIQKTLNYSANGFSDWFMPSQDELSAIYTNLIARSLGSFSTNRNMATSTQDPSNTSNIIQVWSGNGAVSGLTKGFGLSYRPIRAFGGSLGAPVDVETYTARGTQLTFGVGASSNYQAVVYETSTLKIAQANQDKLTLNLYGAVAGSPFTLQIGGGSGGGAVTETVTAGSTAINCRVSNKVLSNDTPATEQKTCNISITKASSRNYKTETLTATVYFMAFVNNQPTGLVGSGSTIALNGQTSLSIADTVTVRAPLVSSVTSTISRSGGGSITIGGEGFGAAGTSVTLKFWRNKLYVTTTSSDSSIVVSAALIPGDATSGPIWVITAHGEAVSPSVTITP